MLQHKKNFSLVYLKLGIHRLARQNQVDILPELINLLEGKTIQQSNRYNNYALFVIIIIIFSILQLYSASLLNINVYDKVDFVSIVPQKETNRIRENFLSHYLSVMLLPYK